MGHWYTQEGNPCHFIAGKNGKDRPTTLRDARKLNLFPSVTEIINLLDKPALNNWRVDQAYLACLTLPKVNGESLEEFKVRAMKDAETQSIESRDVGTEIHAAIEAVFIGLEPKSHADHAWLVFNEITDYTGLKDGWIVEKTFASPLGFGGMCDLHHPEGWVIDHKTKNLPDNPKQLAYAEHDMQLWAYAYGLNMPDAKRVNVFVDRQSPRCVIHEWNSGDDEWLNFVDLLTIWRRKKNYRPIMDDAREAAGDVLGEGQ